MPLLISVIYTAFTIYSLRQAAKRWVPQVADIAREVTQNSKKYVDANPGDFDSNLETGSYNTFQVVEKTKKQQVKSKLYLVAVLIIAFTLLKRILK